MHILFALVVLAADAAAPEDAELFHADGLLLELDGKPDKALDKLRAAAQAQPQNVDYAADAARLAWKLKAHGADADIVRFLALTPHSADQWLLRSYLQAERGESANAKAAVKQSLALQPQGQEALGVQRMLDQVPGDANAARERSWTIRGHVGTEMDSNITLIPDARPFGQGGARLNVGAGGGWMPRIDATQFSVGAQLRLGMHLNNPALRQFDFFNANVAAASDTRFGSEGQQRFAARLFMDQTLLGMFADHFMQEFGATAEYGYTLGLLTPGVYGEGSYRDFVSAKFNPVVGGVDRDGPRWAGGASLALGVRQLAALLRAGVQTEHANGYNQRELGPSVSLGARYAVWRLMLQASVGYTGRFYTISDIAGIRRTDHQMPISAAVQINPVRWLGIELSYLFIRNISTVTVFDYSRHIAGISVKGSY